MTTKWLWAAEGDSQIETVLMRSPRRASVCVSSQAGCAMGCTFCATGQAGFERHLDRGRDRRAGAPSAALRRPSGSRTSSTWGWANRSPTTTRSGSRCAAIHDRPRHLGPSHHGQHRRGRPRDAAPRAETLPVTLAVSLHAPDDALRSRLVPLNHRYPIAEVLDAAAEVAGARGRRVTFEYAGIRDLNDTATHAEALGRLLGAWPGVGRRPREPDPPEPDRRVRRAGLLPGSAPRLRPAAPSPRGQRHGPATPRGRHRRGLRAAPPPSLIPARVSLSTTMGPWADTSS